jgi:glycerophosphoryl diester phosphodiesterase
VDWVVAEKTLEELQTLDAGSWKDPRWKGEPIPTLEEVLATVPAGRRLYIEIKCGPEIVPVLREVLKGSGRPAEETVVISFGLATVREVSKAMPELKTYWLSGWKKDGETGQWLTRVEDLIAGGREAGVDGLDLAANGPLDEDAVARIRATDLEFHVWTVNDPAVARRMISLGVDSITTDRPGWLREQLAALRE